MWIVNKIKKIIYNTHTRYILENSSDIKITDLKKLILQNDNFPSSDRVASNAFYGHAYQLKQYAEINDEEMLNCVIVHGISIQNDFVMDVECSHLVDTMLTYSLFDKERTERWTSLNAIPIGPYIAYAKPYCSQVELETKKNKLGRTLLVFPSHGILDADIKYDITAFCDEIDDIGKQFDTIMVCLYHHDIEIGKARYYKDRGYMVVCAGRDKHFLSRLRMILELSDAVIGNSFTTGLAYALYFNKPVYYYRQVVNYENNSGNNFTQLSRRSDILDEFIQLSSDKTFCNLDKQREWGNYYFGFDEVKTKQEMEILLKSLIRK